jgi:3-hydroxyisobutyrate dehydrogenase
MTPLLFVGLGQIGLPMALRLLQAGFDPVGHDIQPAARDRFAASGGQVAGDPVAAAQAAATFITMLPNGALVADALLNDPGLARALRPGSVVIDMSSSAPAGTQRLAAQLAERDIHLLDAPVSGGVARALDGTLSIMVGGDGAVLDRVMPLLAAMGQTITHTGAIGTGHAAKALNNFVSAAGLVATCEALHLGAAYGLDPETLVAVLNTSTGRNNTTERKALPFIIPETYDAGFSLALMRKDVATACAMAAERAATPPLLPAIAALFAEADPELPAGADHTMVHAFLRRRFAASGD